VNKERCPSPPPLVSAPEEVVVLLQFRLAVRGAWKISMAFGMEPATFLGLIEVMLEMGIIRWERPKGAVGRASVNHAISMSRNITGRLDSPW